MRRKKKKRGIAIGLAVMLLAVAAGGVTGFQLARKQPVVEKPEATAMPTAELVVEKTGAETLLAEMTLEEKLYQMLFVTPESITGMGQVTAAGEMTEKALQQHPVGGIIYFSQNLLTQEQTAAMIENSQRYSGIPLFIGVDEEGGRVSRLGKNPDMQVTAFPPMREIGDAGDAERARTVGDTLGGELRALGFNVDFAPVADVILTASNTEIGDRSFGNDPTMAAAMVEAFTAGLQAQNVSAVLKHFPGHGSTVTDSHTGYSESRRTLEELRKTEFLPFAAGIAAGADFVMVSHMTPVELGSVPASLSETVITTLLREELGFDGIVITDSFSMGAITDNFSTKEAVTRAVRAGVDMILMPTDAVRAHGALLEAVQSGEISEERIDESVLRILQLKEKRGLLGR